MKSLKRIGLVLVLALSISAAFPMQDPSVLLEKAIYTEETLGNLNDAIGIYQQVVANTEAGRVTAALALYRLGMCYQKSGRAADAQVAFAKLTRLYPEQRELISKIPASANTPQFHSAPWVDGELLQYSMMSGGSGSSIGFQIFTIEAGQEDGKSGWNFRMINGLSGAMQSIAFRMDSQYAPVRSRVKGAEQDLAENSRYFNDHLEISRISGGVVKTEEIRLPRTAYDQQQLLYLIRCLPLQEGFETTLPIFKSSNGSVMDLKVAVEGREKIIVAGRSYDCFKVLTNTGKAELTYWFTSDSHKYPVRFGLSGTAELELNLISKTEKNRPANLVDSEQGLSLYLPPGWIGVSSKMMGTNIISLIDPEDEANSYMGLSKPVIPVEMDLKAYLPKVLDSLISMLKSQYKDFQIRTGGREDTAIAGLSGTRLIADHKALVSAQDLVTYLFIFGSSEKIGQIYFKTNGQNFEKLRPAFDSIAYSVQMK